jgi:hypothetical protein
VENSGAWLGSDAGLNSIQRPLLSQSTTLPSTTTTTTDNANSTPTPPLLHPPSKRAWTSSDFVRSDFWFHDGNIVIIAGQAAFKVHRGQLERHSEVFAGLFGLPQPPVVDQDVVDGCPCVVVHDEPSDVFYFLSALYDGLWVIFLRVYLFILLIGKGEKGILKFQRRMIFRL